MNNIRDGLNLGSCETGDRTRIEPIPSKLHHAYECGGSARAHWDFLSRCVPQLGVPAVFPSIHAAIDGGFEAAMHVLLASAATSGNGSEKALREHGEKCPRSLIVEERAVVCYLAQNAVEASTASLWNMERGIDSRCECFLHAR